MLRHPTPARAIVCDLSIAHVADSGERVWIPATFRFEPSDPFAVTLIIQVSDDHSVEWIFARQLLADGARRAVGEGDVHIRPAFHAGERVLVLTLSSPSGHATLELPQERVEKFVRQTYEAVPAELESAAIDWEAELGALLRPGHGVGEA